MFIIPRLRSGFGKQCETEFYNVCNKRCVYVGTQMRRSHGLMRLNQKTSRFISGFPSAFFLLIKTMRSILFEIIFLLPRHFEASSPYHQQNCLVCFTHELILDRQVKVCTRPNADVY